MIQPSMPRSYSFPYPDRLLLGSCDDVFALYCSPELTTYNSDAPRNYEETKEELQWFLYGRRRHPKLELWATLHKETGRSIGRCDLLPWAIDGDGIPTLIYSITRAGV